MVRDDEIERIAVEFATRHEEARGWQVESVETENRGFDLISRRPHPEDPKTFIEVRFIEVKGRAGVGEIALTANEYKTAGRLKGDYWLYAVFNCGTKPELHAIQDPARLGWVPVVQVEHYHIDPGKILAAKGEPGAASTKGSWSLKSSAVVHGDQEVRFLTGLSWITPSVSSRLISPSSGSAPMRGGRSRSGTGTSRPCTSGGRGGPLAACRAVILAALWPDPADAHLPAAVPRGRPRKTLLDTTRRRQCKRPLRAASRVDPKIQPNRRRTAISTLRRPARLHRRLRQLGQFDQSRLSRSSPAISSRLPTNRWAASRGPGRWWSIRSRGAARSRWRRCGSVPTPSPRDLNPVAVLLNKVVLEYIPKYGHRLADEVRKWGAWIKEQAREGTSRVLSQGY